MSLRESDGPRIASDSGESDRLRIVDQRAEEPVAFRELSDVIDLSRGHTDVDELFQSAMLS
jgi:hypothetical protein